MPGLLERHSTQYVEAQTRYRSLEALISEADREPTEVEAGELAALAERMRALKPQVEEAAEVERSMTAMGELITQATPTGSMPPRQTRREREPSPLEHFRNVGEYAVGLAQLDATALAARDALNELSMSRAFVDVTTADVPGLLPPVWLRDFVTLIGTARPFVEAFSQVPLPASGMVITYPTIATRPLVGKQAAEKTDIPSRKTTVTTGTTNVTTWGGGEDVSIQVIQRTDPAYWSLMLELYAEEMAIATNTDAITTAINAIPVANDVTLDGGAPAGWNAALAGAIGAMLASSRLLPNVFVAGTAMWATFAGASDPDGRPLFPNVNAFNPMGTLSFTTVEGNVRGLTFVVDPLMPPDVGIIGNSRAFTSFLGPVQNLSADNPSKLGRDVAVFQMGAFAVRRPDAMIKVTMTPVGP